MTDGPWLGQTVTPARYLLLEIGCLECGNPTHLIGTSDHIPDGYILITYDQGEAGDSVWRGEAVLAAIDLEAI